MPDVTVSVPGGRRAAKSRIVTRCPDHRATIFPVMGKAQVRNCQRLS
jgi:hypothetical protein